MKNQKKKKNWTLRSHSALQASYLFSLNHELTAMSDFGQLCLGQVPVRPTSTQANSTGPISTGANFYLRQVGLRPSSTSANFYLGQVVCVVCMCCVLCACVCPPGLPLRVLCGCVLCCVRVCCVFCACVSAKPPSAGPPRPRTLLPRTAQNFALFPPPAPIFAFFSLWGSSRGIWVVFFKAGTSKCARLEFSGCQREKSEKGSRSGKKARNFGPPTFGPPPFEPPTPLGPHLLAQRGGPPSPTLRTHNTTQHTHTTPTQHTHTTHTHNPHKKHWPKSNFAQVELA